MLTEAQLIDLEDPRYDSHPRKIIYNEEEEKSSAFAPPQAINKRTLKALEKQNPIVDDSQTNKKKHENDILENVSVQDSVQISIIDSMNSLDLGTKTECFNMPSDADLLIIYNAIVQEMLQRFGVNYDSNNTLTNAFITSERAGRKARMIPFMNEFSKFYVKHLGKPSSHLDFYNKQVESSMTPYILEEREMRATQIDIFSRLMRDRLLWVAGEVNDNMSTIVQAQLMFLDNADKTDITMHIDSPGGSVKSGLSMVDVMDYISCDIITVNTGMAASMGSVLLGAGTKGKRKSLRFSRTMLHQSSGGAVGNIQDAEISMREWNKINNTLFELLGGYCGKDAEIVKNDASRDLWLDSSEALEYGIIDEIVVSKKKGS